MIHHIYDHHYLPWSKRIKRINGALTYSQDICKHYLPVLDRTIKKERGESSIVVSTCAPLYKYNPPAVLNYDKKYDVLIQFLHSYPYTNFLTILSETFRKYSARFDEIIFVSAYQEYVDIINKYGEKKNVSARFVPMRIGQIPKVNRNQFKTNRAVWFGNIYDDKKGIYNQVIKACKDLDMELVTINGGKLNNHPITQQASWQIMSDAGIVFGVGRCALEAYALGCEVIIAGAKFGGTVIYGSKDWKIQESTNFNGRLHTGHDTIKEALLDAKKTLVNHGRFPIQGSGRIYCESLLDEKGDVLW